MKKHWNDYAQDMDSLHYTQEQKVRLASAAVHAAELEARQQRRTRRPVRRTILVIAAALAIVIGTASATGALKTLTEIFSPVLGSSEEQIELMGAMGQSIGVSDTQNGVTITADGMIGDKYNACIVYTISWDDSMDVPLPQDWQNNPSGYLMFESDDTDLHDTQGASFGTAWFTDNDPTDNAIQYCRTISGDEELLYGNVTATFENLQYTPADTNEPDTILEGSWKLQFDVHYEDSSLSLESGKSFSYEGMQVTVTNASISPIGIHVEINVDTPSWDSYDLDNIPLKLTKTDGTVLDLTEKCGYYCWTSDDHTETVMGKGGAFDEIIPLDDMATLTIGDLTYDIPHT
ncbi:MAG: DUF4179 domain-containing protein [Eubacteriales bacterium]|nr:DUF4179 domain-containing protein [Eubacteriales bacterium]